MKTCLNRLIGICEIINNGGECKQDYDTSHHPNNYDCVNYQEANVLEFHVVKVSLFERMYMKIGRIFGKDGEVNKKALEQKAKELEKQNALG